MFVTIVCGAVYVKINNHDNINLRALPPQLVATWFTAPKMPMTVALVVNNEVNNALITCEVNKMDSGRE